MNRAPWSRSDAQMGIDFLTGMTIFILSLFFVMQMMFGVVEPFTSTSTEHAGTVDRMSERLVNQAVADDDQVQGTVNYTKLMRFFNLSQVEVRDTLGASLGTRVNVTLTSDHTGYQPRDGLVAYWPMNQRTGAEVKDVSTLSGEGLAPGSIVGPVRRGVDGMMSSPALRFGSGSGRVLVPDPSLDMNVTRTQNLTVAFWMKNELRTSDDKDILALKNNSDIVWNIHINDGEPGALTHDATGGSNCEIDADQAVNTGTWNHVVYVHNDSADSSSFYVNGEHADTEGCSESFGAGGTDLIMGHGTGPSDPGFNGTLDEVRLYDQPFSENETEQIFNESTVLTPEEARLGDEMTDVTLETGPNVPDVANVASIRRVATVPVHNIGPVEVRVRVW